MHRLSRRLAVVLLIVATAAAVAAFSLMRATSSATAGRTVPTGPLGPVESTPAQPTARRIGPTGWGPYELTMAEPLPGWEVSMGDARKALGGPIVLPDTPQLTSSDVGAVWMNQQSDGEGNTETGVAVTFPSQGLIVQYRRPPIPNSLAYVRDRVKGAPGSQSISLNGVPAFEIPQDPGGSNWGSIEFVAGGTTIAVIGHSSEESLQAIAQAILDRTTQTSG